MKLNTTALMLATCVVSGCSTGLVKSEHLEGESVGVDGVVYYLPKHLLKVDFSRSPSADDGKLEKAKAAADLAGKELKAGKDSAKKLQDQLNKATDPKVKESLGIKLGEAQAEVARLSDISTAANATKDAAYVMRFAELGTGEPFADTLTFTVQPAIGDTSRRFVAKVDHWVSRSDELTLKTNAAGLLSTAEGSSTDQTAQIVLNLAQGVAGFGARTTGSPKFGSAPAPAGGPAPTCADGAAPSAPGAFSASYVIDPSQLSLNEISTALCHRGAHYSFAWKPDSTSIPATTIACSGAAPSSLCKVDGLLYRRRIPYTLQVFQSDPTGVAPKTLVQSAILNLTNDAPAERVGLQTGWFVKAEHALAFEDGVLISHKNVRPSELVAAAHLPIDVLMSIIKVPAEIISLKVDYTKKESELVGADIELLKKQEEWKNAQPPDSPATDSTSSGVEAN